MIGNEVAIIGLKDVFAARKKGGKKIYINESPFYLGL